MGTTPNSKKRKRPELLARLIHSTGSRNGAIAPMRVRAIRAKMTERDLDDTLISLKKAEWNHLRGIVGNMTYYMIGKILDDLPRAIEEAREQAAQPRNRKSAEQRVAALAGHMIEASARHGARRLPEEAQVVGWLQHFRTDLGRLSVDEFDRLRRATYADRAFMVKTRIGGLPDQLDHITGGRVGY